MKQCSYCGIDIEDTAVACRWCGTDLKPTVKVVKEVVKNDKPSERATGLGWWVVAIVLSVLLFALCFWWVGRIH